MKKPPPTGETQGDDAGPDRVRPFGYALDEPIFTTFRVLSRRGRA